MDLYDLLYPIGDFLHADLVLVLPVGRVVAQVLVLIRGEELEELRLFVVVIRTEESEWARHFENCVNGLKNARLTRLRM